MSQMDLVDRLWNYRFLGREFLNWLWFKSEVSLDGVITLPQQEPITIAVGDKMMLESGDGEYRESLVTQGSHSDHQEARLGLKQGKTPEEVQLKISRDRMEWQLTLKATTFEVKALKSNASVPSESEEDEEARFFDQMTQIEEVCDILDGLFAAFLQLRMKPDWQNQVLPQLREWINNPG
jgi:hypothetical protein